MKFKYDKYLNMFLKSSLKYNVDQIQDTKIGHVDMDEFLKRVWEAPSRMIRLIASKLHKYASFLVATHNPSIVLEVAKRFDPTTRHIKDANGNVVIRLDSEYFNSIFKGSYTEEVVDITLASAHKWYEVNEDKCKKKINNVFLQSAINCTTSHWPKLFHRSDFTEEYNDIVTLLSQIKGLPDSHYFQTWMCWYMNIIRKGNDKIDRGQQISDAICKQFKEVRTTLKLYDFLPCVCNRLHQAISRIVYERLQKANPSMGLLLLVDH